MRLSARAGWWLVAIGRLGGAIAVVAVIVVLWMYFIREPVPIAEPTEPKAPVARHPQERRSEPEPAEAPLRAFVPPAQTKIDEAVFQIEIIFGIGIGGACVFLILYFILYTPPYDGPRKRSVKTPHGKLSGSERPKREPKEERKVWDLNDPTA